LVSTGEKRRKNKGLEEENGTTQENQKNRDTKMNNINQKVRKYK